MNRYLVGDLDLGEDSLLGRLYGGASGPVRAQVIDWVGHHLAELAELDAAAMQRTSTFWQYRLDAALRGPTEAKGELWGFGWWFTSRVLEAPWSLKQLRALLAEVDIRGTDLPVLQRLLALTDTYPALCLDVLEAGVAILEQASGSTGYLLSTTADTIRGILTTAKENSNPSAQQHITKIVSLLSRRGLDLRDLL